MDIWELMSQECRDEVILIDSACLLETLETYLRKHRYSVPDGFFNLFITILIGH